MNNRDECVEPSRPEVENGIPQFPRSASPPARPRLFLRTRLIEDQPDTFTVHRAPEEGDWC